MATSFDIKTNRLFNSKKLLKVKEIITQSIRKVFFFNIDCNILIYITILLILIYITILLILIYITICTFN